MSAAMRMLREDVAHLARLEGLLRLAAQVLADMQATESERAMVVRQINEVIGEVAL